MRLTSGWWRLTTPETVRHDVLAGLLGATLALPQGIAFATLAGLPPEIGIYTAIVPCIVAAVFGSSHHVVTGPTNAISLALFASLGQIAIVGSPDYVTLAFAVTLLVGLMQFAIGGLRLGWVTNFIAPAVLLGFVGGAAAMIGLYAAESLLELPPAEGGPLSVIVNIATNFHAANASALVVGFVTLATTILLAWLSRRIPYMLLGLVAGFATSAFLETLPGWAAPAHLGHIPSVIPGLSLPLVSLDRLPDVLAIAGTVAIVALGQSVSIAKAMALRSGQPLDVNREFVGQGLANIAGGFFSSYVACGSLNRSAPNLESGARTPLAAALSAVFLVVLALVSLPLLERIPMAAINAALLYVAWTLFDGAYFRRLWRESRLDFSIAAATFAGMFVLPFQYVILIGSGLALMMYLQRTAHPGVRVLVPDPSVPSRTFTPLEEFADPPQECPQIKLVRIEGSVYFGAAGYVEEKLRRIREAGPQKHLLCMVKSMNFVDLAGVDMWRNEMNARRAMGGDLYFHRPRAGVWRFWSKTDFLERLGKDHIFASKSEAIREIYARTDPEACRTCTSRIFLECPARRD